MDDADDQDVHDQILTQSELFKQYSEQNNLFVNHFLHVFWFEYGGRKMGKMNLDILWINQQKAKANNQNESECSDPETMKAAKNGNLYHWRPIGKYKNEFSPHQSIVYNTDKEVIYVLGSNGNKNSTLMFDHKTVKPLA